MKYQKVTQVRAKGTNEKQNQLEELSQEEMEKVAGGFQLTTERTDGTPSTTTITFDPIETQSVLPPLNL